MKRPDRFPRESCARSLMSAHGSWSTRATMKPVRSAGAKVNAVRGFQSASGEELSALMPSILDKAFKGELRNG